LRASKDDGAAPFEARPTQSSLRRLRKLVCDGLAPQGDGAPRAHLLSEQPNPFAPRGPTEEVEEGRAFAPKFDADGLVTCVATDARSGEVLMVAHMNAQALQRTIATGEAWYFSRARQALWRKGESSGHVQRVVEMRVDCDQDAVWIRVEQEGPGACHTGRRSCFYRAVPLGKAGAVTLEFRDGEKTFDPKAVYGEKP
jgi:phosphoribosyl-AMP cyclohydrolase